jgi:hypothetical protein
MSFLTTDIKRGGGGDFTVKLIHGCVDNHYDSDGMASVCATAQSKSSYLKILKINVWIKTEMFSMIQSKKIYICICLFSEEWT